jgi:hypothetical protein
MGETALPLGLVFPPEPSDDLSETLSMSGRKRNKETQAPVLVPGPKVGLLKRTLVAPSTCTHAAVGYFRSAKEEELVLSFETSIQLLRDADGSLEEVCRQHLYAAARDVGVISQVRQNSSSEVGACFLSSPTQGMWGDMVILLGAKWTSISCGVHTWCLPFGFVKVTHCRKNITCLAIRYAAEGFRWCCM